MSKNYFAADRYRVLRTIHRIWLAGQRRPFWTITLAALSSVLLMLAFEIRQAGQLGFPLDDAWIHARFARNLAEGYGWSYNPGELVPGSTSPLWIVLVAALFKLTGSMVVPVKMLGIALFVLSCLLAWSLTRAHGWTWGANSHLPPLVAGLLTAWTARLSWGAINGMEVPLYLALSLIGLFAHARWFRFHDWRQYVSTAVFALAALARPECYAFLPIALFDRLLTAQPGRRWREIAGWPIHLLVYGLIIAPSWLFNIATANSIFPSTFDAKVEGGTLQLLSAGEWTAALAQAVYGSLSYSQAFVGFLAENNLPLLVSATFGLIAALALPFQRHAIWAGTQAYSLIVPLTLIVYPPIVGAIFSDRFFGETVVARYIANVLSVYLLIGAWGIWPLSTFVAQQVAGPEGVRWRQRTAWILTGLVLLYGLGTEVQAAHKHGRMVYDIQNMQVAMGYWVRQNVPSSALLAVNDIGAIAYFSDRQIIDTVGLVTPEVVPYLRQAGKTRDQGLFEYLSTQNPDFLIVFPNWYPELVTRPNFTPVYTVTVTPNVTLGGDTMVVYRSHWP